MQRYSSLKQAQQHVSFENNSPSHYDSEDSCFFADATLEDAHHLVESPAGNSGRASIILPSSLFDVDDEQVNNGPDRTKDGSKKPSGAKYPLLLDTFSTAINTSPDEEGRDTNQDANAGTQLSSGYFLNVPTSRSTLTTSAGNNNPPHTEYLRRKRPPIPRDIGWAAYATIYIPISFVLPYWITHRHPDTYTTPPHDAVAPHAGDIIYGWNTAASSHRGHLVTLLCAILAYGVATLVAFLLYRNPASGDDGEDARHRAASHITLISHSVALGAIYPLLLALLYTEFPRATSITLWTVVILFAFARDLFILRKTTTTPLQDRGQGRRRFFRTLTCASLDILSRSLRRLSFYRIVSAALLLQLLLVLAWRSALLVALSIPLDTGVTGIRTLLILASLVGGKWATSIVARCLGFIASGGITVWFAQQQQHLQASKLLLSSSKGSAPNYAISNNEDHDNNMVELPIFPTFESDANGTSADGIREEDKDESETHSLTSMASTSNKMPEAYRSVDANAYRSVNDFEDPNMYYDDDDDDLFAGDELAELSDHPLTSSSPPRYAAENMRTSSIDGNGTTAKHFLLQAVTISFGSVAKCALLGGLAQFVWSCLRNARVAQVIIARRRTTAVSAVTTTGFQGMDVQTTRSSESGRDVNSNIVHQSAHWCQDTCRQFVTYHTDLGMAHVATYYKSYSRAAVDVSNWVHSSGLEAIIHDDISSAMCASLCVALSGLITILVGVTLSHHRGYLSDTVLCDVMVISFLTCYTLFYTVVEPLRAAIKAVYVSYAQHPEALSQTFPLVFHRLGRIASEQSI